MGYSNGGGFVYDLACRLNDQITGVGAVATPCMLNLMPIVRRRTPPLW